MIRSNIALASGITETPVVNFQDFKRIGNSPYFTATFSSVNTHTAFTETDFAEVISEILDGRFGLEADTLRVKDYQNSVFSCVIGANVSSIEYSDKAIKENNLHVVSANVFADEDDNLWKLVKTGNSTRLVQSSEDDYEGFLATRRVRNAASASVVVASLAPTVEVSDFISFFNPYSHNVESGFVVRYAAKDCVLSSASNDIIAIPENSVLEIVTVDGEDSPKEMIESGISDLNLVLDYMRKIYGNSEMMKRLEELVRANNVR